jgi:hypothetical protein
MVSRDFWNSTNTVPVGVLPSIQTSYLNIELSIPRNATRYLDGIKTAQSRPGSVEENDIGEFKRLSVEECIDAYARPVVSGRRTVIITTSNETEKGPFAFGYEHIAGEHVNTTFGAYRPYGWKMNMNQTHRRHY